MHNSDIVEANSIWMNDTATGHEGINFLKTGGDKTNIDDYECLRALDGFVYYVNKQMLAVDSINTSATNGYVRFTNGLQIAWKKATVTAGGTAWGNLYYSDHSMGNWAKSFTSIFTTTCSILYAQYWCTQSSVSNSSAGTIRCLRPTDGEVSATIQTLAIGRWK